MTKVFNWDIESDNILPSKPIDLSAFEGAWDTTGYANSLIASRGTAFMLEGLARGFTAVELEIMTKVGSKIATYGEALVCYQPARVSNNRPATTHKQVDKMRPRFYRAMDNRVNPDRWWVYNQNTGQWNDDWVRGGPRR